MMYVANIAAWKTGIIGCNVIHLMGTIDEVFYG